MQGRTHTYLPSGPVSESGRRGLTVPTEGSCARIFHLSDERDRSCLPTVHTRPPYPVPPGGVTRHRTGKRHTLDTTCGLPPPP